MRLERLQHFVLSISSILMVIMFVETKSNMCWSKELESNIGCHLAQGTKKAENTSICFKIMLIKKTLHKSDGSGCRCQLEEPAHVCFLSSMSIRFETEGDNTLYFVLLWPGKDLRMPQWYLAGNKPQAVGALHSVLLVVTPFAVRPALVAHVLPCYGITWGSPTQDLQKFQLPQRTSSASQHLSNSTYLSHNNFECNPI